MTFLLSLFTGSIFWMKLADAEFVQLMMMSSSSVSLNGFCGDM